MKVIFTRDIIDYADADHHDLLIAKAGDGGELRVAIPGQSWPYYVRLADGNDVGVNLNDFKSDE